MINSKPLDINFQQITTKLINGVQKYFEKLVFSVLQKAQSIFTNKDVVLEQCFDDAWDAISEVLLAQNSSVEDHITKKDILQYNLNCATYHKSSSSNLNISASQHINENTSPTFF